MNHIRVAAHRGFRAKYAENTLAAFKGAVEVGADIIETDVQVTFDGIVVINHDAITNRVYEEDAVIANTTLSRLKEFTNKEDPSQRILTLVELLQWFVEQKKPDLQLMLDIKANNDVTVLAKIVRALLDVNPDYSFWYNKIIFGLWRLDFYKFAVETSLLSNFKIINITISPTIAKSFIDYSDTLPKKYQLDGVSLLYISLYASEFKTLNENQIKPKGLKLYTWTSNNTLDFKQAQYWGAHGIITDKPDEALAFVRQQEENRDENDPLLKKSKFEPPSIFTGDGFKLVLRYGFYRFFEFLVLHNLMTIRPLQRILIGLIKLVVG